MIPKFLANPGLASFVTTWEKSVTKLSHFFPEGNTSRRIEGNPLERIKELNNPLLGY
jgi:hypothetical protein